MLACREVLNTDDISFTNDEAKINRVLDFLLNNFNTMTTKLMKETKIDLAVKRWEKSMNEETKEKAERIRMNWTGDLF